MPVGGAILGAGAIGAVATTSAANSAAKSETNAANQANATEEAQYNQTRSDLMPYQQTGQAALTPYNKLLGLGSGADTTTALNSLTQTPGYGFTLSQGLKAAQNSAAARGLGVSGAALKGAANYAGGLANSTYNNQLTNYLGAAQLGESAASQTGAYGTSTAASVGNNLTSAGNAQAAASMAGANALTSGLNSTATYAAINPTLINSALSQFLNPSAGGMYGNINASSNNVDYDAV